jgi:hypothetical protein
MMVDIHVKLLKRIDVVLQLTFIGDVFRWTNEFHFDLKKTTTTTATTVEWFISYQLHRNN